MGPDRPNPLIDAWATSLERPAPGRRAPRAAFRCRGPRRASSSSTCVDFLETRSDVRADLIGLVGWSLDGVVERITCPFLITHGENDRQIPLAYARRSYEQAVNAAKRELRVFTPAEGATEHIGLDHLPHVGAFTADWVEDTFREVSGRR